MSFCHPMPCVDPEMKNALAIQRNTAAITALTQSFQKISDDFDSLKEEVETLNANLKDIVLKGFEDIFDERLKAEETARKDGDLTLKSTCADLDEQKADKKDLEKEIVDRKDADLVLKAQIQAYDGLAGRLVEKEACFREEEDAKLSERITALEGGSSTIPEQIAAEKTAREEADSQIESKIDSVKSEIDTSRDALAADIEKRATKEELKAVNEAHANLVSYVDGLEKRIVATESMSSDVASIKEEMVSVKQQLAENGQLISDLSARETEDYNSLSNRISNLEKAINDFIQR